MGTVGTRFVELRNRRISYVLSRSGPAPSRARVRDGAKWAVLQVATLAIAGPVAHLIGWLQRRAPDQSGPRGWIRTTDTRFYSSRQFVPTSPNASRPVTSCIRMSVPSSQCVTLRTTVSRAVGRQRGGNCEGVLSPSYRPTRASVVPRETGRAALPHLRPFSNQRGFSWSRRQRRAAARRAGGGPQAAVADPPLWGGYRSLRVPVRA